MQQNYIDVTKAVWKWYQSSILEPNDYCLMMRLIAICNDDMGWENCFLRNNYELIGSTKLSYKQLQNSRNKLQQIGLISFEQRNGLPNAKYTIHFSTLLNLSKKVKGLGKVTARLGKGEGVDNINQTKPNIISSEKISEEPIKNQPIKKDKPETKHWKELVDVWFTFYKTKYLIEPTFNGVAAKNLKDIVTRLEKMPRPQQWEWTDIYATASLKKFLEKAYEDSWLQKNYLLQNLANQFDKIATPKNNGNSSNTNTAKPNNQKGAGIDELQALKRGAAPSFANDTDASGDANSEIGAEWQEAIVVE